MAWVLGVIMAVLAGFFGALGKLLMRYSHIRTANGKNSGTASDVWKSRGIMLLAILSIALLNPVLNMVAYSICGASLIAPFMGLPIAWNVVLAPCILGEVAVRGDFAGALLMVVGTGMVAAGADHTEVHYNYVALAELYGGGSKSSSGFYVFAALCVAFSLLVGCLYTRSSAYRSFAIGAAAGTLGGFQFLVKSVSELVANDTQSFTQSAGPYLIVLGAVLVSVGGIVLLNYGLKRYEAIVIVPVYQCFICVVGALGGLAYFKEAERMVAWQYAVYFSGMFLLLAGVCVIFYTRKNMGEHKPAPAYDLLEETGEIMITSRDIPPQEGLRASADDEFDASADDEFDPFGK